MTETSQRSTIISFNSVERLLRGDFFHSVTPAYVRDELAAFPAHWPVAGLGTTNWYRRNGELLIDGSASRPRFLWADPASEPVGTIRVLDARCPADEAFLSPSVDERRGFPYLPFAAVAACDPDAPALTSRLQHGADIHDAVREFCEAANVGLASVRVRGPMRSVDLQAMCHIPIGGVDEHRPAEARTRTHIGDAWHVLGFYSANPTIRPLLGFNDAAVHLHGCLDEALRGGHINAAVAAPGAELEVRPVQDLVLRIRGLDVASLPMRELQAAG